MTAKIVGLRILSVIFGIVSLWLLARLWARSGIVIGDHHVGRIAGLVAIAVTGVLGIWLSQLAGPWRAETKAERRPKT